MVKITQLDETTSILDNDVLLVSQVNLNKSSKVSFASIKTFLGNLFATIHSPIFTGEPKSITPTVGDNSTKVATTAFTKAEIIAMVSGVNVSLTTNGYQKLPSGLIMQWGSFNGTNNSTVGTPQIVIFPTPFTSRVFSITLTEDGAYSGSSETAVMDWTTPSKTTLTQMGVYTNYYGVVKWFAIGY
jgi:hypothetical protein